MKGLIGGKKSGTNMRENVMKKLRYLNTSSLKCMIR